MMTTDRLRPLCPPRSPEPHYLPTIKTPDPRAGLGTPFRTTDPLDCYPGNTGNTGNTGNPGNPGNPGNTLETSACVSRSPTPASLVLRRISATSNSPGLNSTITGLSPVVEEQLSRQKSETFEVVDSDNTKFTFSIISEIAAAGQDALGNCVEPNGPIKKTCRAISECIRYAFLINICQVPTSF